MQPMNDNILIKIKKGYDKLQTISGIILAGVDQDVMVAEVVAVPKTKVCEIEERDHWGSYVRDARGNPKMKLTHITVQPENKIIFERKFHHNYDAGISGQFSTDRPRVDHMVPLQQLSYADAIYDYFLIRNEDILLTLENDIDVTIPVGELLSTMDPKPVTRAF